MNPISGRAPLGERTGSLPPRARRTLDVRRDVLLDTIGTRGSTSRSWEAVEQALDGAEPAHVWLALAVISGKLPDVMTTAAVVRSARLDGPRAVLHAAVAQFDPGDDRPVEVVDSGVIVDLFQTARLPRSSGIQRVAREIARAWRDRPGVRLVGWDDAQQSLVDLTEDEVHHLMTDGAAPDAPPAGFRRTIVVPCGATYVIPELSIGLDLSPRQQAMVMHSGGRTGAVGFDTVPLTASETTPPGAPSHFAGALSVLKHVDRVATISHSAAEEFRGWRTMLGASGLSGPDVVPVPLPAAPLTASADAIARARTRFLVGDLPLVLVVGAHEPRKNHDGVLHAARLLWARGREFSLLFVGAPGWNADDLLADIASAQRSGLPVESAQDVDDATLAGLYALARCTVAPSLTEGFGLPVMESIMLATPAVTSRYGALAEITALGGALLVDPLDERSIADAIERLLLDDTLHATLVEQTRAYPRRTWAEFADALWTALVEAPQD